MLCIEKRFWKNRIHFFDLFYPENIYELWIFLN